MIAGAIACAADEPATEAHWLAGLVGDRVLTPAGKPLSVRSLPKPQSVSRKTAAEVPLTGLSLARGRPHLIQQDNGASGSYGFREGRWKLVRHDKGFARNLVVEHPLANTLVPRYQLFDLDQDPGERHDRQREHPEIAAAMLGRLEAAIAAGRTRPVGPRP
jgi:arylsulfatase A-like enzyme